MKTGILSQAQFSSIKTSESQDKEKIELAISEAQIGKNGYQDLNQTNLQKALKNNFEEKKVVVSNNNDGTFTVSLLDSLKDYKITQTGLEDSINWNTAMSKAVAPETQNEERNKDVIGIGTDGKPVDMDLWEFTMLDDNTIGLNDSDSIKDINKNAGYLGNFENGNIIGTIPQYISTDNGESFLPVTSMFATFCELSELKTMPQLPTTVKDITNCFIRCSNLVDITEIPTSVKKSSATFKGCTSLIKSPEIPVSVKDISSMFEGCSNLKEPPTLIPSNVEDIHLIFRECQSLQGEIKIEANLTGKMILPPNYTDIYRSFYNASLKSNNVSLKVYLNDSLYELFTNNLPYIIDTNSSNSNIEFIKY